MRKLRLSTRLPLVLTFTLAVLVLVFAAPVSSSATTTFTTLVTFDGANGANPESIVQGRDGNLYGTTTSGGSSSNCTTSGGCGTVFKITPSGTLTTLYNFCSQTNCADGHLPIAGLIQATDGNFYGTTYYGGAIGFFYGTIFKITPSGSLTTLHSFDGTDGQTPSGGLVQATNGSFYGTTTQGGADGVGTVFKITPSAKLTTLYNFCSQTNCTDDGYPSAGLVLATNGNFYGSTSRGGALQPTGTVFKITPSGALTTLHSFKGSDGSIPTAELVQATDGNLYGTTTQGGANGVGTVFKITPSGTLTTLYNFCSQTNCTDGGYPGGLVQDTNGTFYGATTSTIFSLSVGLDPFVEADTYSGKVGNTIEFLGQGFTSSSAVFFNGTKSPIVTAKSGTYLTAVVPNSATTGFVTVTTSSGTLKSNKIFRVVPQITSFSPTGGPPGTSVTIDGESFTGATSVTFGGVKATTFTVDSYTKITVTVPSGAKTGQITVTTPGGTATSSGTFTVT